MERTAYRRSDEVRSERVGGWRDDGLLRASPRDVWWWPGWLMGRLAAASFPSAFSALLDFRPLDLNGPRQTFGNAARIYKNGTLGSAGEVMAPRGPGLLVVGTRAVRATCMAWATGFCMALVGVSRTVMAEVGGLGYGGVS